MIRVGTSGYSYSDWVGTFYPAGTKSPEMLAFYSRHFSTVELNFSYYRMPDARTLARMSDQVPAGFTFSVKAPAELSHQMQIEASAAFIAGLEPLRSASQLAAVLVQFPFRFKNELASRRYLAELAGRLEGLPVAVEFRHSSWINDAVLDYLRRLRLAMVCVDMPALAGLLPPLDWVTAPLAYVRFHGRNAQHWWQHDESWQRYDYRYSDAELSDWLPRLRGMQQRSEQLLVYMNNHAGAKATADAQRLVELLAGAAEGSE